MTILTWGLISLLLISNLRIQFNNIFKSDMNDKGVIYSNITFVIIAIFSFLFLDKNAFIILMILTFGITGLKGLLIMTLSMKSMLNRDTIIWFKLLWMPTLFQLIVTYISIAIYFEYIVIPSAFKFYCNL